MKRGIWFLDDSEVLAMSRIPTPIQSPGPNEYLEVRSDWEERLWKDWLLGQISDGAYENRSGTKWEYWHELPVRVAPGLTRPRVVNSRYSVMLPFAESFYPEWVTEMRERAQIPEEVKDDDIRKSLVHLSRALRFPYKMLPSPITTEDAEQEKASKFERSFEEENMKTEGKKYSDEAQDFISNKIRKLKDEGKEQGQAVAIAHEMARKKGYDIPKKSSHLPWAKAGASVDISGGNLASLRSPGIRPDNPGPPLWADRAPAGLRTSAKPNKDPWAKTAGGDQYRSNDYKVPLDFVVDLIAEDASSAEEAIRNYDERKEEFHSLFWEKADEETGWKPDNMTVPSRSKILQALEDRFSSKSSPEESEESFLATGSHRKHAAREWSAVLPRLEVWLKKTENPLLSEEAHGSSYLFLAQRLEEVSEELFLEESALSGEVSSGDKWVKVDTRSGDLTSGGDEVAIGFLNDFFETPEALKDLVDLLEPGTDGVADLSDESSPEESEESFLATGSHRKHAGSNELDVIQRGLKKHKFLHVTMQDDDPGHDVLELLPDGKVRHMWWSSIVDSEVHSDEYSSVEDWAQNADPPLDWFADAAASKRGGVSDGPDSQSGPATVDSLKEEMSEHMGDEEPEDDDETTASRRKHAMHPKAKEWLDTFYHQYEAKGDTDTDIGMLLSRNVAEVTPEEAHQAVDEYVKELYPRRKHAGAMKTLGLIAEEVAKQLPVVYDGTAIDWNLVESIAQDFDPEAADAFVEYAKGMDEGAFVELLEGYRTGWRESWKNARKAPAVREGDKVSVEEGDYESMDGKIISIDRKAGMAVVKLLNFGEEDSSAAPAEPVEIPLGYLRAASSRKSAMKFIAAELNEAKSDREVFKQFFAAHSNDVWQALCRERASDIQYLRSQFSKMGSDLDMKVATNGVNSVFDLEGKFINGISLRESAEDLFRDQVGFSVMGFREMNDTSGMPSKVLDRAYRDLDRREELTGLSGDERDEEGILEEALEERELLD